MEHRWILPVPEYYARLNAYIQEVGLPYDVNADQDWNETAEELRGILGDAQDRSILDSSCGWGTQTIALATSGWRVTACDVSETSLAFARQIASQQGLSIDFRICDMRFLGREFDPQFDTVINCYGLYEIPTWEGIEQAIRGMFAVLKPGGQCYLQFRDMDDLVADQPRHVFHGEKRYLGGRVICIQDWDYESEDTVIAIDAFLREDETKAPDDYLRWTTETIGVRKIILRKARIEQVLLQAGFTPVTFLPQPELYLPVRIVAVRPD